MNDHCKSQCTNIMKKLQLPIFVIFQTNENLKNSFPSISSNESNISLEKISSKLRNNKYKSKGEWIVDIQQIWIQNLRIAEENDLPLLDAITTEFRDKCLKLILKMTNNEEEEFWEKASEIAKKLNQLTSKYPKELSDSIQIHNIVDVSNPNSTTNQTQ